MYWNVSLISILLATPVLLQAGVYSVNFDSFPSGTANLSDGSSILDDYSPVESYTAAEVFGHSGTNFTWTALRLVQDQAPVAPNYAAFVLPDLDPGAAIEGFDLSFDLLMKSTGSLGDGFSFSFGDLDTTDFGNFEDGFPSGGGDVMSVSWDTFDNGGSEISGRVAAYLNGVEVAGLDNSVFNVIETTVDSAFQSVDVSWSTTTGLSVNYGGTDVYSDDALALSPNAGDLFAFAARTGGATQDVFVDNIDLTTVVPEPAVSSLCLAFFVFLWAGITRRRSAS